MFIIMIIQIRNVFVFVCVCIYEGVRVFEGRLIIACLLSWVSM